MWGNGKAGPEPVGQSYGEGYIELPGREAPFDTHPFGLYRECLCGYNQTPKEMYPGVQPNPVYPVNGEWAARFLGAAHQRWAYMMSDTVLRRDLQTQYPGLVPTENSMTADLLSPLRDWGKSLGMKRYSGG